MSKKPAKKKGPAKMPPSSPKHEKAELRKSLYSQLEGIESKARELLDGITKLRHGNLDYIAKMSDMQDAADQIAEELGDVKLT